MPNAKFRHLLPALMGAIVASPLVDAQPIGLPQKRPIETPLDVPEYPDEQQPLPLTAPPVREPPPAPGLPALAKIYVQRFGLAGNTVFTDEELAPLLTPYENRQITATELQRLRHELTLFYINQGYINSGAIIPDQTVEDGLVTIQIIEGELSDIQLEGNERLADSYIRKRVELGAGPPLSIVQLGEALQILQQNPRIEQINARLTPGTRKGESVLSVKVREAQAYELWVDGNNHQPPSVGGEQASVRAIHRNLSSFGDTLSLEYYYADGLDEWDINYSLPVTARDSELYVGYTQIDSEVVESPFDDLDIESDEKTFSAGFTHPLYRTVNRSFALGLSLDKRQTKTFLLGQRFDFTPASENGKTDITVLRFTQEWTDRQRKQVLAARSMFSRGVDWLDATVNGKPQDGKFTAWLGQLQWVRRVGPRNTQLLVKADAQWSPNALPSMEQVTIGGRYTVRGYRENRLIADKGVVGSVELRFPVYRNSSGSFQASLAPFADYGAVSANNDVETVKDNIGSIGIGLLGSVNRRMNFELYYGYAFQDFDDANDDIQDDGLSFNLSLRLL